MTTAQTTTPTTTPNLATSTQRSWTRFLHTYEPLRSELYRYCRYLTRSPWDAEDLAQDTMARAFVTLAKMAGQDPVNPRAWLFRIASNLWIDTVRRQREIPVEGVAEGAVAAEPRAPREAAGTLLVKLSPQERAAVVLKDVFDLSLEETAETLGTTVGAVKAALHRGRGKLEDNSAPAAGVAPAPGALDAFCAAFNAGDMDRLASLLLDTSVVEVVGATTQYGPEAARRTVLFGMLNGSKLMAAKDPITGMNPQLAEGVLPVPPRAEARLYRGRWIVLLWYKHVDGEAVRGTCTVEIEGDGDDGRVAHLANYFYCPDFLVDLGSELGVPVRVNGLRWCASVES